MYQYNPYMLLLFASGLLTSSLGLFTMLRRRKAKGAAIFIASMFTITIWSMANAFEMSAMDFSTKLFWANLQYIAFCYAPVTLVVLCMQFTGYDKWLKSKKIIYLAVIPTIVIILVWTDRFHGLVRYNMHMDYNGLFPVIDKRFGPAFFIHAFYSHLLNTISLFLLINAALKRNFIYKKQAIVLLLGVSLIVIPNVLYILGLSPIQRFDITPVFFGPAGLIMFWGIFQLKFFELVPLARATVMETMDAGIMVLDLQNRILDINPACARILELSASQIYGRRVQTVFREFAELVEACTDESDTYKEFSLKRQEQQRIYEVILSPLSNKKGILLGRLVVIYDITEKKQVQQALIHQQWKQAILDEREWMARDLHDNLGQVLGFINMQTQGIRHELMNSGNNTVLGRLDQLVEVTQSAHDEIREFVRNVIDPMEKDFISSLQKDIAKIQEQTGIHVELLMPPDFNGEELKPNVSLQILNIVKEALNNVRKHAEANSVKISFSFTKEQLCATIEDDGKGFDIIQGRNSHKDKFGLDIMHERASKIGGQLQIDSAIGKGCRIILYIPK